MSHSSKDLDGMTWIDKYDSLPDPEQLPDEPFMTDAQKEWVKLGSQDARNRWRKKCGFTREEGLVYLKLRNIIDKFGKQLGNSRNMPLILAEAFEVELIESMHRDDYVINRFFKHACETIKAQYSVYSSHLEKIVNKNLEFEKSSDPKAVAWREYREKLKQIDRYTKEEPDAIRD